MTKGADLYRLQCLDDEAETRRRRLAEIEAALGENDALRQAHQALERAQTILHKWTLRQRDLELEIKGLSGKISRSEQRLYSGSVKNPKELSDLQAEVSALRRRRQKLEDDLLEVMIAQEEADATNTQAQEHLTVTETKWSDQQAKLGAEQEILQEELAALEKKRAELLPSIEAGELAVYETLRQRKGGVAVVQVRDGACGGCGVTMSSSLTWQLRQGEMVYCGNCERIIVRAS